MLFEALLLLLVLGSLRQGSRIRRSLADNTRRLERVEEMATALLARLAAERDAPNGSPDEIAAVAGEPARSEVAAVEPRLALPPEAHAVTPPVAMPAGEDPSEDLRSADPPPPRRAWSDLELDVGRRWAVLLGGGVLAIGLALLVRQTFEEGLLPPAARLGLAALGSLALAGAAELFRRRGTFAEMRPAGPLAFKALPDIPSTLFGAGLAGLFASSYAAHGVYGLVGAPAGFVLLAAVALAGLASSLVYGPPLAALGYAAAQAVPLLTGADDALGAAAYVALTSAAAFGVARLRRWGWLQALVATAMTLWVLLLRRGAADGAALVAAAEIACILAAAPRRRDPAPRRPWAGLALAVAAAAGLALATPAGFGMEARPAPTFASLAGFAILAVALVASAVLPALALAAPVAAVAAVLALALCCAVPDSALMLVDVVGAPPPPALDVADLLGVWALFSAAGTGAVLAWVRTGTRGGRAGLFGVVSTVAALAAGDLVLNRVGASPLLVPLLATGQGAALFGTGHAGGRRGRRGRRRPTALAAAAGGLGLGAVALALALSGAVLTTALGAFVTAAALLAVLWRAAELVPVLAALSAVVIVQGAWHIAVDALGLGPEPGLPEGTQILPLMAATAIPGLAIAAALALVTHRLPTGPRRRGEAIWRRWLGLPRLRPGAPAFGPIVMASGAGGLLLAGALAALRLLVFGDAYAPVDVPADVGLAATFAFALAGSARRARRAVPWRALVAAEKGAVALGCTALAAAVVANPLVASAYVGSLPLLNLLAAAYLLPALFAAALAWYPDTRSPRWMRALATGAALVGILAFASFSVMQAFQGPVLDIGATGRNELWTYTPVWLVYAVGLFGLGLRRHQHLLRLVALAAVAAVAGKAFLIDLSFLSGLLRALSFIALGGVLLGLGMVYQRQAGRGLG